VVRLQPLTGEVMSIASRLITLEAFINCTAVPISGTNSDVWLGAFYDSLGFQNCGGAVQWYGVMSTFSVWGKETGIFNGFASGDTLEYKICIDGSEYDVSESIYFLGPEVWALNGLTVVQLINASSVINLEANILVSVNYGVLYWQISIHLINKYMLRTNGLVKRLPQNF